MEEGGSRPAFPDPPATRSPNSRWCGWRRCSRF